MKERSEDMTGWDIVGIIVGVGVVVWLISNLKDLARYLKISSM